MDPNNKIIDTFEILVDKPKKEIYKTIEEGMKNTRWSDFLYEPNDDYNGFTVTEEQIEIAAKPSTTYGFRSYGMITMQISENAEGKSLLTGKVLIPKYSLLIQLIVLFTALAFFTLVSLCASRDTFAIIIFTSGECGLGLIVYLFDRCNRYKLIQYSKEVIKELSKSRKASRE